MMTDSRQKVFISAYACEPGLGSEIGVGWHWVLEMSKYFDLWVLTRKSNQQNIEHWLKENPLENPPTFLYFDLPPGLRFWKKGLRGVRTYYVLWQHLTNGMVKRCMQQNQIKVFHLLTYGNALWPVSRYGRSQFFVWGPTSVGDTIPREYSRFYDQRSRVIEAVRRLAKYALPFNVGFRQRCRQADLILCKTERTLRSLPVRDQAKATVCTDVAVERLDVTQHAQKGLGDSRKVRYLAVGRLDAWRGFDLLIEALAKALKHQPDLQVDLLGKGPDQARLERLIAEHGLQEKFFLRGQVSMQEYYEYMHACDVVVNPALKEGAVTTAFDSLSFAKPLICIDTGGYTRYFSNEYGVVIPLGARDVVVQQLSESMLALTDNALRDKKGALAAERGGQFTWEEKGQQIAELIHQALAERGQS
jgi:glycosyltransferase involved in cell wall biosynthesis